MDRRTNSKGTGGTTPKNSNSISGGSASRKRKAKKAFEDHSTGVTEGTGGTKPKNSNSISGGSASRKRKAKKAFEGQSTGEGTGGTKPKNSKSISGGSASRKRKAKKAFEGQSTGEGTGGTKPKNSNSISGGSASRKRKAEQAFEGHSTSEVPVITVEDDEVKSGEQSDGEASKGEEFTADIVFALDYSSTVTEEELQMEINFVQYLSQSWNVTSGTSAAALVLYGNSAQTVIAFDSGGGKVFSDQLMELKTPECRTSQKWRRMDLALEISADNLSEMKKGTRSQHQLVVLFTAGKQLSDQEREEDNDLLASASEKLSSEDIKVVIVPVGFETDFKELGLIVKRPQCLFPLSAFRDLTPDKAQEIASYIKKTIDIDVYAKNACLAFSGTEELALWEKISLCSDVMEGAWYCLYDEQKKSNRPEKVKRLIRESIDNFHSTLVSDSKISISLAVCGTQGAGKSFFLNFLLNWGLHDHKVQNGPLPSAHGGSQTPIPIYVKYGKKVQVLMHKREKGPDIWFQSEELGIDRDTLARVNDILKTKFEHDGSLGDANCIELLGPFPIFNHLRKREMTTTGHLELDIDVEFVDVPGYGDKTGNESINIELSRADVVLFIDSGKSGRPVSSEDIAQVFRRREEFSFPSRPKLVHLLNDRQESSSESSCNFDRLREEKKKDLERAWSSFLSSSADDKGAPGCYKDVRAKLPQLNGEVLLKKLFKESDVIYFHPKHPGLLDSLKHVIDDHIHNVKIKQRIHPFLQDVHWTAKRLRNRIGKTLTTEKKKRQTGKVEVKEGKVNFELLCNGNQVSDLVNSFVDQAYLPLDSDIPNMYSFLYDKFLNSHETVEFLLEMVKLSLDNYKHRLIEAYKNANWSTTQDIPGDLIDLVEILCKSRVEQFCAKTAPTYLMHVLEKEKNRNPLSTYKKRWSCASSEEKKDLCVTFLDLLLERTRTSLMKNPRETTEGKTRDKRLRDKQFTKSHFHLMEQLEEDVKDMFAVRCLEDNASRPELLKVLHKKLRTVIQFCTKSIRDINPHPSLDVQADPSFSLPEIMTSARDDKLVQSKHGQIIKEITDLLVKPPTKRTDPIRKLESRLSLGKNALALREPQSPEQRRFWAKVLLNVLRDENHFNFQPDDRLCLPVDDHDPELEKLLKQARKRLFAHQKSFVTCKIVSGQGLPDNELHLRRSSHEECCLEVLASSKMQNNLHAIREEFIDPMHQLAPVFIPTIRPGPTADIRGNFFLEEDPWSNDVRVDEDIEDAEDEGNTGDEGVTEESKSSALALTIFLVVEKQHLEIIKSTINSLEVPTGRNMIYVVLPQQGRGIGVTRAIIKSLAECLKFHLYWTVDDDIQFMFQFDGNARKWLKCSIARGLLFGQRVFQTCLKKAVKELSRQERVDLCRDVTEKWPDFAGDAKAKAMFLLFDDRDFAQVQGNPILLHSPFVNISKDCGWDAAKEERMKACEQEFVGECKKRLFEDAINHIAGVSLAHESTKKYDYMSNYPSADYMLSEQRYQVVLNNTDALKEMNYVTDEVIFHPDENQITDIDKRNTPCWGIRGADKSFSRALTVGGIFGYQVIRVVHSHKKLINAFDRVGPSYIGSQSPYRSEDEEDMETES